MIHIFCDIQGTFFNLSDEKIKKMVSLINKLDTDKVIFSFISSADIEFVKENVNKFKKYINNTKIELGLQFAYTKYLNLNKEIKNINCSYQKAMKMLFYLDTDVKEVIYIDDYPSFNPNIFCYDELVYEKLNKDDLKFTVIEKYDEAFSIRKSNDLKNVLYITNNGEDDFLIKGLEKKLNI